MIPPDDFNFWEGLWKVIVADIVLAGDNAVVIALAVRSLPERQQFWGRIFGAFGAVVLRVLFVAIISTLLQVPFLQLVGALLLIWIAVKLVQHKTVVAEDDHVRAGASLWEAIRIIVIADVVMSFDNVMAISGASKGHLGLVIFGLLFSIPLVVIGSGLLSTIMRRYPWLIWLGAGLLGHVAGEMILADPRVRPWLGPVATRLDHFLPLALGASLFALGWLLARGTPRAKEVLHVPEMNVATVIELNAPAEVPPRRLSDDLRELLHEARGRSLTIAELELILQGRGFGLFILLMSLPFCFPIAVPGLSIPFGIVIMLLGLRIAMGQKPALPGFILQREIKYSVLERIVRFGLKLTTGMEKIAKPRMSFLRKSPGMINLIGVGLASGGIQLLLPLPPLIPLSNTIPAISVVLLTAGMIERDGVFVLAGYIVNLIAWVYFAFMFAALGGGISYLYHAVRHFLGA